MKKITVLALLAAVLMVAPAFAVTRHLTPSPNATFAVGTAGVAAGPATTNNDDSCDIGTAPAATLLLPYFDVDIKSTQATAHTTLFTITNVSNLPQIAHVTVWTDWSFPVLDFNIYLTGYDVQAINLYDIFNRGIIAPQTGTSDTTVSPANPTAGSQPACATTPGGCAPGALTPVNGATTNPNINSFTGCANLPGAIPTPLLACVQSALTTGVYTCGCTSSQIVGGTHADAIGYITVDVNANCNTSLPNQATYFTTNILFDNVLIGDYQQINPNPATGNYAGGNPMVSIRAVPEGGSVGSASTPPTNLPDTFYDRYEGPGTTATRRLDRRQPLPSLFAARYIQGGTGAFNTNYEIWREGITTGQCSGTQAASSNSALGIAEIVRFDEHENATTVAQTTVISPAPNVTLSLPETSSTPTSASLFPAMPSAAGDVAGWMYLNLHNGGTDATTLDYSRDGVTPAGANRASQNWVSVDMYAEGRYETLFDAAWLGNGCSPPALAGAQIGPAGGVLVCPPALTAGTCNQPPIGTNVTPP